MNLNILAIMINKKTRQAQFNTGRWKEGVWTCNETVHHATISMARYLSTQCCHSNQHYNTQYQWKIYDHGIDVDQKLGGVIVISFGCMIRGSTLKICGDRNPYFCDILSENFDILTRYCLQFRRYFVNC